MIKAAHLHSLAAISGQLEARPVRVGGWPTASRHQSETSDLKQLPYWPVRPKASASNWSGSRPSILVFKETHKLDDELWFLHNMYIQNIMFYNSSINIFFIFIVFTYPKHSQSVKKKWFYCGGKAVIIYVFLVSFHQYLLSKRTLKVKVIMTHHSFLMATFRWQSKNQFHQNTPELMANNEWAQANASKNPD